MTTSDVYVWQRSPERHFEEGFRQIAQSRMRGLPICNPKIHVRAFGFTRYQQHWIGAVVTPWSLMVVFACGNAQTWFDVPVTKITALQLPAGSFSFMGIDDPLLGKYLACSLMSPLTDLPDQRTAEAIASQALSLMMSNKTIAIKEEAGTPLTPEKTPFEKTSTSRRDFFAKPWK